MSKISNSTLGLHPHVRGLVINILADCKKSGINVDVFETDRTLARQISLKNSGKSKTLNSYHRLGLAVDLVFKTQKGNWTWRRSNKKWDELAAIMERNGMRSLWKRSGWDGPHCELRFKGVSTATLYKEFRSCDSDLSKFWDDHINPRLGIKPKPVIKTVPKEPTVVYMRPTPVVKLVEQPKPNKGFWEWLFSFLKG